MKERISYDGVMAARIDRLPLTRVQWQLAVLVEVTWGFIIFDTDGIAARLCPFIWRPAHIIDVVQHAVIQAMQVGLGIFLGVIIMGWVADRDGRRPAILLATLLGGVCIWPFAYVTDFTAMVVLSVVSTLGVGGIVATHSVYLSEMTSPEIRNRVLCLRGRGRELGFMSQRAPDALAATALEECGRQEAAYAKALKPMRITGICVAFRNDLGEKISGEISDVRAESRGQLEAERGEDGSATVSAPGPGP